MFYFGWGVKASERLSNLPNLILPQQRRWNSTCTGRGLLARSSLDASSCLLPGGVILQWPGTPLLGPTIPALPGTWQRKGFLKQRETQEDCSVPARAASQLGMTVNLENQFGACSLPADTPQGRPRPLSAQDVVASVGRPGAPVCWAWGRAQSSRCGARRRRPRTGGRQGMGGQEVIPALPPAMSRVGSLGQPRSLTARAPALLALWLRCPSSDAFWTVVLGLPRLLQKWTGLTRGWWPTRDLGSSECGPVVSDVSQSCLLKRTVLLHCSRMSGLH